MLGVAPEMTQSMPSELLVAMAGAAAGAEAMKETRSAIIRSSGQKEETGEQRDGERTDSGQARSREQRLESREQGAEK